MVHISYLKTPYYQNQSCDIETMKGSAPKEKEFIENKYYYLKPTDLSVPRFYGQPKINSQFLNLVLFHIVTPHYTMLPNT